MLSRILELLATQNIKSEIVGSQVKNCEFSLNLIGRKDLAGLEEIVC